MTHILNRVIECVTSSDLLWPLEATRQKYLCIRKMLAWYSIYFSIDTRKSLWRKCYRVTACPPLLSPWWTGWVGHERPACWECTCCTAPCQTMCGSGSWSSCSWMGPGSVGVPWAWRHCLTCSSACTLSAHSALCIDKNVNKVLEWDGEVEGSELISWEDSKITNLCWTTMDRRMLAPPKKKKKKKKDTLHPRAKEKPQHNGTRGKIMFRNKPQSCQRHSEGSNKTLGTLGLMEASGTWL